MRDKHLLLGLLNYGLLSTRQIQLLFFTSTKLGLVDRRTVLRRLRILSKKKWIIRHKTSRGGEIIWTLNSKGAKYLESEFYLKGINRASLYHDLVVSDMRIELDQLNICSYWQSSHYLRFKVNLKKNPYARAPDSIPDWLFSMKLRSRSSTIAMEVELNFKGVRRQLKVFEMYNNKNIDHIWYLVPTKRFGEKILKVAHEFMRKENSTWVFFSIIDEVKLEVKTTKIYFLGGDTTLSSLCGLDADPLAHTVSNEQSLQKSLSA